ncbi:type II toxin-antitoxin system PemK/MazF family toxin [Mumia sp. Pv 4-285]|uniref:type II toxin-antitoxin system PemK/MazF family toxin n=1 Tax=Mumia qirimensis TaxID=3234852 RepID=UPI00351D3978
MSRTRDVLGRLMSALVPTRRSSSTAAPGALDMTYAPKPDGRPDPGEIVWTWVAYEDDPRQGKDRPVLVVGRRGSTLVAVTMTSKDHDRDAADEARWGRHWLDIGAGGWDRQGRPSEVRLDRLITVDPTAVRREGAVLPRERFDAVVAGVRKHADVG